MQKLRDYQIAADAGVRKAFRDGAKRVLLTLPTGGGKNTLAAKWLHGVKAKGSSGFFLADRRELIDQASQRLLDNGVSHGIIMSGVMPKRNEQIQVGSIQSVIPVLYPRDPETAPDRPIVNVIVLDECDTATSNSCKKIFEAYPDALVLGITATPQRTDGRGLGDIFDVLVEVVDVATLIEDGWLCDYRIFEGNYDAPDENLEVTESGEFDEIEMANRLDTDELVGDVYSNWKARADGKQTIVFAQSRKHGKHLLEVFLAAGENFAYVDGTTNKKERDDIIRRFGAGLLKGIINVGILVKGFDVPGIECIVLAFMTASIIKYRQTVGRGLRPVYLKGLPLGTVEQRLRAIALGPKSQGLLILDHGGNARHRFGGPDAPHEWSLDGRKKRAAPVQPVLSTCPTCRAIVTSRTRVCPDCGYEFTAKAPRAALPDTADGMLVEANYKIRGSEKAEREKARILALSEKEQRAIAREAARVAKAEAAEAKLRRIEEEKDFLRAAVAKLSSNDLTWKMPLTSFRRRFKDEKHPTGYFPGKQHGAEIKFKQIFDQDERKMKWTIVAFEFEGKTYGQQ